MAAITKTKVENKYQPSSKKKIIGIKSNIREIDKIFGRFI
jgi:hypothetical protein